LTESTFPELEALCEQIKELSDTLATERTAGAARDLIDLCQRVRPQLRDRYGNIREKLSEVIDGATLFTKQRVDVDLAIAALRRSVGKLQIALTMHRDWPIR
jgi:polyhydroxyalkanoate synthesis regulator phasin